MLSEMRDKLYSFLWKEPDWVKCGETEEEVSSSGITTPTQSEFNLDKFLAALEGWVPKHSDGTYQQIVYYCLSQKLDQVETCTKCNAAWNYSDRETEKMMENAQRPESGEVGKGSMVRILVLYATKEWNERDIFGRQYYFHNEAKMFDEPDRIWSEKEIEDFVNDVYSYTWGDGKTQFIYREQRTKRFGAQYFTITNTVITDSLPFSDP